KSHESNQTKYDKLEKNNIKEPPWTNPYGNLSPSHSWNDRYHDEKYQIYYERYHDDYRNKERSIDNDWNKFSPKHQSRDPYKDPYRDLSSSGHHYVQYYRPHREEPRFNRWKNVEKNSYKHNNYNALPLKYYDPFPNKFHSDFLDTNNQLYHYYKLLSPLPQKHSTYCDNSLLPLKLSTDNRKDIKQNNSNFNNYKDCNNVKKDEPFKTFEPMKTVESIKKINLEKKVESVKKTNSETKVESITKIEQTNLKEQINNRSRESRFEKYRELVKNRRRNAPFFITREDAPNLSEIQRIALELLFL
ncbi:4771_t:CDS:1, partial [Scutellospora calospora]